MINGNLNATMFINPEEFIPKRLSQRDYISERKYTKDTLPSRVAQREYLKETTPKRLLKETITNRVSQAKYPKETYVIIFMLSRQRNKIWTQNEHKELKEQILDPLSFFKLQINNQIDFEATADLF